MKKEIFAILLLIMGVGIALAQNATENQQITQNISDNINPYGINFIKQTNELLNSKISISETINPVVKWVIKNFDDFKIIDLISIILSSILIILTSKYLLELTKSFKDQSSWLGGIAILIILAISSLLGIISEWLLKISEKINPFKKIEIVSLIILIIILSIIFAATSNIAKKIKAKEELTESERIGQEIGTDLGFTRKLKSSYGIIFKK